MRGGIRQDEEKKRSGASTIRRKRRREGESGVVWTSGERDVASGRKKRCDVASGREERCDASQDAQDARDAEYPALASGRNAGGSDARSVFADVARLLSKPSRTLLTRHCTLPTTLRTSPECGHSETLKTLYHTFCSHGQLIGLRVCYS